MHRPRLTRTLRLDAALSRTLKSLYGSRADDMRYRPTLWTDPRLIRLGRVHLRSTLHTFAGRARPEA